MPVSRAVAGRILTRGSNAARNWVDRAMHKRRHTEVCQRLSNSLQPGRILVVCQGNIIRSPYLQRVLQRALAGVSVASAGFLGSDRSVPTVALCIAASRGVDLSQHRSRPLTQSVVNGADLVIVMDRFQARELAGTYPSARGRIVMAGDLDPVFDRTRAIKDPWNQPAQVFESSFDRLDRCAATVVSVILIAKQQRSRDTDEGRGYAVRGRSF